MARTRKIRHEIDPVNQGSLFDPSITGEAPTEEPQIHFPEHASAASVVTAERARRLHNTLGFLAFRSRTGQYETIDENPWFQRRVYRSHPHDYVAHIEEVLANRERFAGVAEEEFKAAFGVQELIDSGQMTEEEANELAEDFYYGRNKSGLNESREGFVGQYADPKNNNNRKKLKKVLEGQNPSLKKKPRKRK